MTVKTYFLSIQYEQFSRNEVKIYHDLKTSYHPNSFKLVKRQEKAKSETQNPHLILSNLWEQVLFIIIKITLMVVLAAAQPAKCD